MLFQINVKFSNVFFADINIDSCRLLIAKNSNYKNNRIFICKIYCESKLYLLYIYIYINIRRKKTLYITQLHYVSYITQNDLITKTTF